MLSQPARNAKNDFQTESAVRIFAAVRGTVETRFLRSSMDSFSLSALIFSGCYYCAN